MNSKVLKYGLVCGLLVALALPLAGTFLKAQQEPADAAAAPGQNDANGDRVVIRIGEETITAREFNEFVSDLPPQYQMMAMGPGKRMLAEELVRFKLMAAEARRRGLDQTPQFERRMKLMREQLMASALVDEMQGAVDEASARAYFEENKQEFEGIRGRHILVTFEGSPVPLEEGQAPRSEEQAKAKADELRARIVAGEDFAEIAQAESEDRGSGARGGDLGTFGRGQMVPEFEGAAFAMQEGELSQPVRSPFGYHIIQVQQRVSPAFDEIRPEIEERLGPERMMAMIEELNEKHPTELDEEFFGPANAQPAFPFGME